MELNHSSTLLRNLKESVLTLYLIAVLLGGTLLFFYFLKVNYVPYFDLATFVWILLFIFGIGVLIIFVFGIGYILPWCFIRILFDDIRRIAEKGKYFKFSKAFGCRRFTMRVLSLFFAPWLLMLTFSLLMLNAERMLSKILHHGFLNTVNAFSAYMLGGLGLILFLTIPLLLKKDLEKNFQIKTHKLMSPLFFAGFIHFVSLIVITLYAVALHEDESQSMFVILAFSIGAVCTWLLCTAKSTKELVVTISLFLMLSFIANFTAAKPIHSFIYYPIKVFNLGQVKATMKIKVDNATEHEKTVEGILVWRIGPEYVLDTEQGKIVVPRELVKEITFENNHKALK